MVVNVKPEELDSEVQNIVQEWSTKVREAVNKGFEDTAESTANLLKKGGPYRERTGKYTRDWSYKPAQRYRLSSLTEEYRVYNKKHYQLTHLLEKGHLSRKGNRVRAYEHIAPAEQQAEKMVVDAVNDAVKQASEE